MGERRKSLVQNIDMAPTLLKYFGMKPTKDMLGHDLAKTIKDDTPVRDYAILGAHGNLINITDGRFVYMRSPMPHTDFYEYTMMPNHLSKRFTVEELKGWSMSRPFELTKDLTLAKSFCGSLGQYMLRYIYDITEQKMYSLEEIPFA